MTTPGFSERWMAAITQSAKRPLSRAKEYNKGKFHALLSDPPYHLTSIVKRFGKTGSAPAQYGTDGVYSRASSGFMGQTWDGGDIAFRPETWAALGEHLYPGAFGMAFSASRNWHRLAAAIEDAGFVIHPTIFGWLNGQGFPKATRIDTQIDKAEGNIRADKLVGGRMFDVKETGDHQNSEHELKNKIPHIIGKGAYNNGTPISDMAKSWEGHRYGLQALKPAIEPIIVFQKPYEGKPLDNITSTGAGALNIDAGRIETQSPVTINRFTDGAKPWGNGAGHEYETEETTQGRWPSNFILDKETAPLLDAQTGELKSGLMKQHIEGGDFNVYGHQYPRDVETIGDSGGASRFFYTVSDAIDDADPIYYCAKVSKKERNGGLEDRNQHPTMKPIDLATYLAKLLLPPDEYAPRRILVPFSGVASEMIGCFKAGWEQIVGIEFDTENGYVEIAKKRMEYYANQGHSA